MGARPRPAARRRVQRAAGAAPPAPAAGARPGRALAGDGGARRRREPPRPRVDPLVDRQRRRLRGPRHPLDVGLDRPARRRARRAARPAAVAGAVGGRGARGGAPHQLQRGRRAPAGREHAAPRLGARLRARLVRRRRRHAAADDARLRLPRVPRPRAALRRRRARASGGALRARRAPRPPARGAGDARLRGAAAAGRLVRAVRPALRRVHRHHRGRVRLRHHARRLAVAGRDADGRVRRRPHQRQGAQGHRPLHLRRPRQARGDGRLRAPPRGAGGAAREHAGGDPGRRGRLRNGQHPHRLGLRARRRLARLRPLLPGADRGVVGVRHRTLPVLAAHDAHRDARALAGRGGRLHPAFRHPPPAAAGERGPRDGPRRGPRGPLVRAGAAGGTSST